MERENFVDAVTSGGAEAVGRMLSNDPALAAVYTDDGWPLLHVAPTAEVARLLIDAGADLEARNQHAVFGPGNRALHAAVYQQRADVIELLLSRGADVNSTDNAGWTPLHIAVASGHVELAQRLLETGADPNARLSEADGQEWSGKTVLGLLSVSNRTGEGATAVPAAVDEAMRSLLESYCASAR